MWKCPFFPQNKDQTYRSLVWLQTGHATHHLFRAQTQAGNTDTLRRHRPPREAEYTRDMGQPPRPSNQQFSAHHAAGSGSGCDAVELGSPKCPGLKTLENKTRRARPQRLVPSHALSASPPEQTPVSPSPPQRQPRFVRLCGHSQPKNLKPSHGPDTSGHSVHPFLQRSSNVVV